MLQKDSSFEIESIELEKIYMVMDLRLNYGYSAYETSFLLGRRDFYVRDIENPLHTLKYSVNENNYLRQIFNCSLKKIMPGKVEPTEYIIQVNTNTNENGLMVYQIELQLPNGKWKPFRTFTEEKKGTELPIQTNVLPEEVSEYITKLFAKGHFRKPKTALTIFKTCEKKLGRSIRPIYVSNALATFTGKRKSPRLIAKTNESGRMIYWEG